MTAKQFFTNPITITVGSILIIVGIAWVGKNIGDGLEETASLRKDYTMRNPINNGTQKKKGCAPECLEPYPKESIYYGYYYCKTNCAVFERTTESQQGPNLMFNISPKSPITPNPDGGPRPNPTAAI